MHILPATAENIAKAADIILAGGIVGHATETCYGLACDMTNLKAVTKLFDVKQRSHEKSVSALFSSIEESEKFVLWTEQARELAKKYLPGPLTIILRVRPDTSSPLFPAAENPAIDDLTLGVRISSHPVAMQLSALCKRPISTTSANLASLPSPYSIADIVAQFEGQSLQPDILLDSGVLPFCPPSTIVDCSKQEMQIVRQGDIDVRI